MCRILLSSMWDKTGFARTTRTKQNNNNFKNNGLVAISSPTILEVPRLRSECWQDWFLLQLLSVAHKCYLEGATPLMLLLCIQIPTFYKDIGRPPEQIHSNLVISKCLVSKCNHILRLLVLGPQYIYSSMGWMGRDGMMEGLSFVINFVIIPPHFCQLYYLMCETIY